MSEQINPTPEENSAEKQEKILSSYLQSAKDTLGIVLEKIRETSSDIKKRVEENWSDSSALQQEIEDLHRGIGELLEAVSRKNLSNEDIDSLLTMIDEESYDTFNLSSLVNKDNEGQGISEESYQELPNNWRAIVRHIGAGVMFRYHELTEVARKVVDEHIVNAINLEPIHSIVGKETKDFTADELRCFDFEDSAGKEVKSPDKVRGKTVVRVKVPCVGHRGKLMQKGLAVID